MIYLYKSPGGTVAIVDVERIPQSLTYKGKIVRVTKGANLLFNSKPGAAFACHKDGLYSMEDPNALMKELL